MAKTTRRSSANPYQKANVHVHTSRLKNPSGEYLSAEIDRIRKLLDAGECHPDWAMKEMTKLGKMLDKKTEAMRKKEQIKKPKHG